MSPKFSIPRFLISVTGIGLIGFWAWGQYNLHLEIDEANRILESPEDHVELLLSREFPTASQEMDRGRFLRDELFPLNYPAAEKAFINAVKKDPLSARTWLELSELYVQVGRLEDARLTLEKSDQLDPNYPRDRSKAIVLWFLLEEEEKAFALAERLASLGGNNVRNVTEILFRQGRSIDEVMSAISKEQLTNSEVLITLNIIAQYSPESIQEFWHLQSEEFRKVPANQKRFAQTVKSNNQITFATELWKLFDPELEEINRLLISSPTLIDSPLNRESFALGWNTNPKNYSLRWVNERVQKGCTFEGAFQYVLDVDPDGPRNINETFKVSLGSFVLKPGDAKTLVCRVSTTGIKRAEIALEIQTGLKTNFQINEFVNIDRGCVDIEFPFPSSDETTAVNVAIILRKISLEQDVGLLSGPDSDFISILVDELTMIEGEKP